MRRPLELLGGLSPARFLVRHWQKSPLLVRGALPALRCPIAPETLAALACREDVESRLVLASGGRRPWELRHGPFRRADFARLPATRWTLLVHEVDRHVPAVAALLAPFRFLPNWRLDDVMVSYAAPGGSVGAHVDRYDVFLVQGAGARRWRWARQPRSGERFVPGLDLRILRGFVPDEDEVLGPGDLLYLPPRVAHHGIAIDACTTLSIGFRAPAPAELLAAWAAERLEGADPDTLYADPDLEPQRDPGRIAPRARARLRALLRAQLGDDDALDRWLGRFFTQPTRAPVDLPARRRAPAELAAALRRGRTLRRSAPGRFAHLRDRHGRAWLFVGGTEYALTAELAWAAPLLCGREPLDARHLAPHLRRARSLRLLAELVHRGFLILDG